MPTPKRNILCLLTDAFGGTGGIALYNRDFIDALCEQDDVGEIIGIPRVAPNPLEPMPDKLIYDLSGIGGAFSWLKAIFRHIRSGRKFDLIYCAHVNLIPAAVAASKLTGAPWCLVLYGIEGWTPSPRFLSARWSSQADKVISLSGVTQERFLKWCAIPQERCCVVANAVHLEQFGMQDKDPQLIARHGLEGRKVVMTLGRLDPDEKAKGFDRMIELMPALQQEVPNLSYLIVGKGGDQPRLEALAREHGVDGSVIFAGFVSEEDKPRYYALADAYVMPSTMEGFGFVYTEAMACGIPVVGSSSDGSREALREGLLGALVDPFDPVALKAATLEALAKPKAIPEGLSYFSFDNFKDRLWAAVGPLMGAGT